eukprot:1362875-Pyramimonas_sp.AAC.1
MPSSAEPFLVHLLSWILSSSRSISQMTPAPFLVLKSTLVSAQSRKFWNVKPGTVTTVPSLNLMGTSVSAEADLSSASGKLYSGAGLALLESRRYTP